MVACQVPLRSSFLLGVREVELWIALDKLTHLLLAVLHEGVQVLHEVFLELDLLPLLLAELVIVVGVHVQPRMLEHLLRRRSPIVVPLEHGEEKVAESLRLFLADQVLIGEDFLHRPVAEVLNST